MKKSGLEVERDVFALVNASPIKSAIKGSLYRNGMRPINSITEDAVVSFMTGLDGQFQTGVVTINIYVPDIDNGQGAKVKDLNRCLYMETIGNTLVQSLKASDYRFSLASMVSTFQIEEEGVSQHMVNIKLKFELKTF